ncbi:class I SAM-dependent methyltransferase [Janibacter limosus]|uniref:Class I SAM-dependent methyltransferase n=1 Tax=Janibacter limosus TaxID=53458 RepID=A0A4P6MU83_9MICO|nr:class I SAM-dependent methyltransferase [Janibacter limosus]QBF47234.1 class I SAM-dependent methyltransferase [Janibacter limosus]
MPSPRPLGNITRGTTNPNRLRRCDRWLVATHRDRLTKGELPHLVDLGHGASGVTTVEWADRVRAVRPDVHVTGLEIDPERVATAQAWARPGVDFALGGFEVPLPQGRAARVIRAFNVLRQYDEAEVEEPWRRMTGRLEEHGVLVEGTCDELGRLGSWLTLDAHGPQTLTLSWRLRDLDASRLPSVVAERLPKALIHRNVPGEPVHDLLRLLDDAWRRATPFAPYGARQQAVAAFGEVATQVAVIGRAERWRLGELTVPWSVVAPRSGPLAQRW